MTFAVKNIDNTDEHRLRERVLEVSERLFRARGYSPVTMDGIADSLGVSKKTLYKVFSSKEEILLTIVRISLDRITAAVDSLFEDESMDFVQRAAGWLTLQRHIHDSVTPTELMRDIRRNAPAAWTEITRHLRSRSERVGQFFALGSDCGDFRTFSPPLTCARVMMRCSAEILEESVLEGLRLSRSTVFDVFGRLFYTGMLTPAARSVIDEARSSHSSPPSSTDHAADTSLENVETRILNAGRSLMLRFGYSKVRMDEIAHEVGISKKTLYNHFSGKEVLLREVMLGFSRKISNATFELHTDDVLIYVASLRAFVVNIADTLSEFTPQFLRDLSRTAPHLWDELLVWRSEHVDKILAKALLRGQRIGAIRDDISAARLAKVYRVALDSVLKIDELAHTDTSPVDMYRTIVNALFIGTLEDDVHHRFSEAYDAKSVPSSRPSTNQISPTVALTGTVNGGVHAH